MDARSDRVGARVHDAAGSVDDPPLEAVVEGVRHGIDQVADKVKGLLRSNR